LKKVTFIVLSLFVIFVATGYLLPKQVHIERSITVDRPASVMFELLNSYRYYNQWSPLAERDTNVEFVISGPESGVGAHLSWIGEPHLVGTGWQEIVASKPYELINIKLDFEAQGVADTGYRLVSLGNSTRVTWFFDSDLTEGINFPDSFLGRYFGLLFDRWVGGDYEQGLANLKQYAESLPVSNVSQLRIERVNVPTQNILFVSSSSSQDPADIARAMATAYAEIRFFMADTGNIMTGRPMAITRAWEEGGYQFDAAIPVDFIPAELPGNIQSGLLPSGPAVRAVHHGGYDQLMPVYEKLAAYMSAHGLSQGKVSWEHYISKSGNNLEKGMITHIYIMLEEQNNP
jgi:effector-binding domain-containing protein